MKFWKTKRKTFLLMAMLLCGGVASAQVVVKGNVYGGCELGKVQINSSVTNSGNSTVTINGGTMEGSVYGGGMGSTDDENHGAVLGNTTVTMNNGTVERSIYGGGELGSVGTFTSHNTVHYTSGASVDVPTKCQDGTGLSTVTMSGGFVGKNGSKMPTVGSNPDDDDRGWIFCGSQGEADSINYYKAIAMGVVKETHLTISGGVVTASVYGGCENGLVLTNTLVDISGGQIGTGYDKDNDRFDPVYSDEKWTNAINAVSSEVAADINTVAGQFHECHSWPYTSPYNVYDYYYGALVDPNDPTSQWLPANSANQGSNGHSFFGNVFGGGSGYYPIAPGVWRRTAGRVNGNATVNITGGHILTSIYGGNETTDVMGKATVNMSGGTLGVPRTFAQITAHPVTCYLFGSGMGDPRTMFNQWTNVQEVEVNITGGTIFGSVFGGGEEGHVLGDVEVNIGQDDGKTTLIGTWGYSYVDGNVFGGGRGFTGTALTAGSVGGNIEVNISKGKMLGSIYGGGRLASVGTYFVQPENPNYGQLQPGTDHGYITVNITGGTIGNNHDANALANGTSIHTNGGNVFGGSMGRIELLDNINENYIWPSLARTKHTQVNITGSNSVTIKGFVYGGSEKGSVSEYAGVTLNNENVTINRVFGGGYGSDDITHHTNDSTSVLGDKAVPALLAGRVMGTTKVEIKKGTVETNVYGGGELASVGVVKDGELLGGTAQVVVSGGTIGPNNNYTSYNYHHNSIPRTDVGHVFGGGQGKLDDFADTYKAYCNINYTNVTVKGGTIYGSVFGGGADSHVLGNTSVSITTTETTSPVIGTSGVTSWDGCVFGGGMGDGRMVNGEFEASKTLGRVAGKTYINMDGGWVKSSIFGGGRTALTGVDENGTIASFVTDQVYDSTKYGLAEIHVSGLASTSGGVTTYSTVIGIDDYEELLKSDESVGDIFGSGMGDTDHKDDINAGRVANVLVEVTGSPRIYGSVFGGGEMSGVGYWSNTDPLHLITSGTGSTFVTIGSEESPTDCPVIGTAEEFTVDVQTWSNWTDYETVNNVTRLKHTATGNVYGASQGDVNGTKPHWVSMGRSNNAWLSIHGGTIMGCVYGGAEQGTMTGNSVVKICGNTKIGWGIDGTTDNRLTAISEDGSKYSFGSVYGGGYGSNMLTPHTNDSCTFNNSNEVTAYCLAPDIAGRTYGNITVKMKGGHVFGNVYGGGDLASVGWVKTVNDVPTLKKGHCIVEVSGSAIVGPMDGTGMNGYVYGAGKGVGEDPTGQFNPYCNVNSTEVVCSLNETGSVGHVYGSLYGGGSEGHVLGNTAVTLNTGIIGTYNESAHTVTDFGGNIFGGGRNFVQKTYAAGRVGGNTHVVMNGGTAYGSVFGGGRMGMTGVAEDGMTMQAGEDHGNTVVEIKGGTVGCRDIMQTYTARTIGDVYGGGKGDMRGILTPGHPAVSALLLSIVKNTNVEISGTARILGSVFGGGEVASVGHYAWQWMDDPLYDEEHPVPYHLTPTTIGNIRLIDESGVATGVATVTVKGGIIGADRMQMRYDLASGDHNYNFVYHDDVGHVFGGGEGLADNPALYAQNVNPGTLGGHNNANLIDLMASVGETHVTITKEGSYAAWVKGSVYGGSMSGHVLCNTEVTVSGGQIGAGNDIPHNADSLYKEARFFSPLDYAHYTSSGDIRTADTLAECVHWKYDEATRRPFDPIKLKEDYIAHSNYNESKPTNGESWFGCVFGGGSGYYPYIIPVEGTDRDTAIWNHETGKVYGQSTVHITGGHILTGVYGGCEISDVGTYTYVTNTTNDTVIYVSGGQSTVTMSGGTVGVPRVINSIQRNPITCNIYGAGKGNPKTSFDYINNVNTSSVTVSDGAIVYGSVFGGAENGHVMSHANVIINQSEGESEEEEPVIGTTGFSGYDGLVFGGGRGNAHKFVGDTLANFAAGRVGGNATITMSKGTVLGNLYGGGFVARTGVGVDGSFEAFETLVGNKYEYDSTNLVDGGHGMAKIELSGGTIGNHIINGGLSMLMSNQQVGNVYGSGRGDPNEHIEDDLGRVANATVHISGSPTVYGSVYGGGQMANVGHWNNYNTWYSKFTSTTLVTIEGTPTIGSALEFDYEHYSIVTPELQKTQYDTINGMRMIRHTRTGNVFGSGQGDVIIAAGGVAQGLEHGHCGRTYVNIGSSTSSPTILCSVFGGSEQGAVWGDTKVVVESGTIGQKNIESNGSGKKYSFGNVFGGSCGMDAYQSFHLPNPAIVPEANLADVVEDINNLSGHVYGNTHVEIKGGRIRGNVFGGGYMASVGDIANDTTSNGICTVIVDATAQDTIGPRDGTGFNANVFGGGKGFSKDPNELRKTYANVDSTFVAISGGKIGGSVFGGGSDSHVLGSTSVEVHAGADIGTDGLSTMDGNIFGGGRNFLFTNHTNGRVAGNVKIVMDGGTIQGSIFGGGRMALTGVDVNGDPFLTSPGGHEYDSINHGLVTINITSDTIFSVVNPTQDSIVYNPSIGNYSDNGHQLLYDSNESVGDIFGSGKGDTKDYDDIWGGRVANVQINISGQPRIYGSVFGGGEMASVGYWYNDNSNPSHPKSPFYAKSGVTNVTIEGAPVIGTDMEFRYDYAHGTPSYWTVFDDNYNLIHTCTGNVYGGSQGDVDTLDCHWVSMARSRKAYVTINMKEGGIIKSRVFGGAEQGTVAGNTYVTVKGKGTIGSVANAGDENTDNDYLFGGVYGGGYGSHNPIFNGTHMQSGPAIVNDSTDYFSDTLWTASHLAGRVYGNTLVKVLGATIQGDVYGGASYAYIGGYGANPNGNATLYIGDETQSSDPGEESTVGTTINGSVFGANNHSGTPYGDVNVHIYHTAHTIENAAPTTPEGGWTHDSIVANTNGTHTYHFPQDYALKEVFGGGNHAHFWPNATRGARSTTVHVHRCENTIKDLYGGGNAADIGKLASNANANVNLIVEGGRFDRVFGGGNGAGENNPGANIYGSATTDIDGGVINYAFGGGNEHGIVLSTQLDFTHGTIYHQNCDDFVDEIFGGSNESPIIGDVITNLYCGDGYNYEYYGGTNNADIWGNVTLNVYGGNTTNLYGGSKGNPEDPEHGPCIKKYPTEEEIEDNPEAYPAGLAEFLEETGKYGEGGTVKVNLYGGTIENVFGGNNATGNIEGLITINVIDTVGTCPLDITNIYGASNDANYTPKDPNLVSPVINIVHIDAATGIRNNVYGGAKGISATVTSNPVVNIGYQPSMDDYIPQSYLDDHMDDLLPLKVHIGGNVFGGGEYGTVDGSTHVNMVSGVVGDSTELHNHLGGDSLFYGIQAYTLSGGRVYGGGQGNDANKDYGKVTGNTYVNVSGTAKIRNCVYGGGLLGSVGSGVLTDKTTGVATVVISGGVVGPLDGTGLNAYVYGGGQGEENDPLGHFSEFANVDSTSVIVCDSARIYGSIFGGGSDGHVLGNARVQVKKGDNLKNKIPIIGTNGMTSWDGNIFGGGRNYRHTNYTAGRVGGNIRIEMTEGTIYGNIYGGGRLGLTGVDKDGLMQDGPEHGNTKVIVKGGIVGNVSEIETFSLHSMGNVYGGGMGTFDSLPSPHHAATALLLGLTKNTEVIIKDSLDTNGDLLTSPHVYGMVLGGGELANVGKYTWNQSGYDISNIQMVDGTGLAKVRIHGGIIGGDRTRMRYDHSGPDLTYNDDLGYVYGGGEGYSDDPANYIKICADGPSDPKTSLLDLMATVNSTDVKITGGWVKASVFGGSESGHVRGNTKVTIKGGQIGAGYSVDGENNVVDLLYEDSRFINPLTTPVTDANSLSGTAHWPYGKTVGDEIVYTPFDPAYLSQGNTPSDGKSWFGNVFGGGSGWFPYITGAGTQADPFVSHWNPISGKVWGNTEVIIADSIREGVTVSRPHILNNVYGANESTDVGGKATITMSGGTVGVPRTPAQVAAQPVICYVFGGGAGDPRIDFNSTTNVASTEVNITGGIVYGSVFGGAEDGHVLGNVDLTIGQAEGKTTVIGSTGMSGADGNIFCGGRNYMGDNLKAGRVEGNITLNMSGGTLLGSVFGGGRYAQTGIGANGAMLDGDDHGNISVTISGGTVGNASKILDPDWLANANRTSMGDVFGSGKGHAKSPDLGKVKNDSVVIKGTARVLGNVYGGGEMANVGWYETSAGALSSVEGTGKACVTISGNAQVGIEQIGANQATILNGSVFGGGLGKAGGKKQDNAHLYANVDSTHVTISGDAMIYNTVFGGGDNGHVVGSTVVDMTGGTVGQKNTLKELITSNQEQYSTYIYTGNVLGGGKGITEVSSGVYNDTTGIVFGNTNVTISGGTVRHGVYGGGGLSHVGTFAEKTSDTIRFASGTGVTNVTISGNAHIGPTKEDLTQPTEADRQPARTGYESTIDEGPYIDSVFKYLGGNCGLVFGAGCGLVGKVNLTYNDSAFLCIAENAQVVGSVFGGGENGHVARHTNVDIKGGIIGGVPLHSTSYALPDTNAYYSYTTPITLHLASKDSEIYEDKYGTGRRVFRGEVYGGGKGTDYNSEGVYSHTAARVLGNTSVTVRDSINGDDIEFSPTIFGRVYGGGSIASVGKFTYHKDDIPGDKPLTDQIQRITYKKGTGITNVTISGGQIGTDGKNNGDVVGGGRGLVGNAHGYDTIKAGLDGADQVVRLAYVNSTNVTIDNNANVMSSVYGGSLNGHVYGDTHVNMDGGTVGYAYMDTDTLKVHGGWHSNVYGGGGGTGQYKVAGKPDHLSITSGRVYGNTNVTITNGHVYHNVYGGGPIASIGTYDLRKNHEPEVSGTGTATVTIEGGTIGLDSYEQNKYGFDGYNNGMVFGSGRGEIDSIGAYSDSLSFTIRSIVNIGKDGETGPKVKGSVYGSGENGHVYKRATVNVYSGTIGCNYDEYATYAAAPTTYAKQLAKFPYRGNVYGGGCGTDKFTDIHDGKKKYNPQSGIVWGDAAVNVSGGYISRNVYGAGAMASVGYFTSTERHGADGDTLSWPCQLDFIMGGRTDVTITGGHIGTVALANDPTASGCVYGSARGEAGKRYEMMPFGNVKEAYVTVNFDASGTSFNNTTKDVIIGSVFGSGESGHVYDTTSVTITKGLIAGSVFGAGDGTATYEDVLLNPANGNPLPPEQVHSITAGKVFGNTSVTVLGGYILHNVYGGGNLASVGKGNYNGEKPEGYTKDYGESGNFNVTTTKSGRTHVRIYGGQIGTDGNENGHVFGSSRGLVFPSINLSPRYNYSRDFFLGYTNKSYVTIGENVVANPNSNSPRIYGSVFGGGQDGHVRLNTQVIINDAEIGVAYGEGSLTLEQREYVGNVYGAGRGIGMYDSDGNGTLDKYCPSSGSVTRNTHVIIKGGHIHRDVFGGGSLATLGPPVATYYDPSFTTVDVEGGTIGDLTGVTHEYGGNVFGSSRGKIAEPGHDLDNMATVVSARVNIGKSGATTGPTVWGSVYGSGDNGHVKDSTEVYVYSGTIGALGQDVDIAYRGNVFGGGSGMDTYLVGTTPTHNPKAGKVTGHAHVFINGGTTHGSVYGGGNTSAVAEERVVTINGGTVKGNVFGGCNSGIAENTPFTSLKTVNVRGGHICGNVFGGSYNAKEKHPDVPSSPWPSDDNNNYWSSFVNITGGTIDHNVYAAGYGGDVDGSVCVNIGRTAVLSSPTTVARTSGDRVNTFYKVGLGTGIEPSVDSLNIGGDVFGGSYIFQSGGGTHHWNYHYDITGYSTIFIDGEGYETTSDDHTEPTYMNLAGGIYGSGTFCESGAKGREIVVMNYGTRNNESNQMKSATRTLTTLQRCDVVLLDNSNVNFTGAKSISDPDMDIDKFGVIQVDSALYVTNASGIVLGTSDVPAYMDSIHSVSSFRLTTGTSYQQIGSGSTSNWKMLGVKDNNNKLYLKDSSTALDLVQENAIIFNNASRLWVRYRNKADRKMKYGELQGFFRARVNHSYHPIENNESFAYARPKLTPNVNPLPDYNTGTNANPSGKTWNAGDGGFLSYNDGDNFFTDGVEGNPYHTVMGFTYPETGNDGGAEYTKTKQYPYYNVSVVAKDDPTNYDLDVKDYRLWALPSTMAKKWYVDGRGIGPTTHGWGQDLTHKDGWGHYPDMPKLTITGTSGIYNDNTGYPTYADFDPKNDIIFVVGPVSALREEANLNLSMSEENAADRHPLRLYRYPGGHEMSNGKKDLSTFDHPTWIDTLTVNYPGLGYSTKPYHDTITRGPGANYGAMIHANKTDAALVMENVKVDGLFVHDGSEPLEIPTIYTSTERYNVGAPLVVTETNSKLTLKGGTILQGGYNKTDAAETWYPDPDYEADVAQGGGIFVANNATVNVEGLVTIMDNKQKKGDGEIFSNVYLPRFRDTLVITAPLDARTEIGVTSPRRNSDWATRLRVYNTFSPVAVIYDTCKVATIQSAWRQNNIRDDQDWFFGNEHHTTYYKGSTGGDGASRKLYFGWTWANVVRKQPAATDYVESTGSIKVKSEKGLAWLISKSLGMNGVSATNFDGVTIQQTGDFDMEKYVWVPIGEQGAGNQPFAGTFDGQGHLIKNLNIEYIGKGDYKYELLNYGLFGYVRGGTVKRAFVMSGEVKPDISVSLTTEDFAVGGLVGCLDGGTVCNSETALKVNAIDNDASGIVTGGLVGLLNAGEVHSSMSMAEIITKAENRGAVGGMVGKATGGWVSNSFVNADFTLDETATAPVAGGLLGTNAGAGATVRNCYVNWTAFANSAEALHFRGIVSNAASSSNFNYCYARQDANVPDANLGVSSDNIKRFTPRGSADQLGYMYSDNVIEGDTTLAARLNMNAYGMNKAVTPPVSDSVYAHWARPGLAEINGDLPVLLLNEFDGTKAYQGTFRSVGGYDNSHRIVQYGGPARDGDEVATALTRPAEAADKPSGYEDCLFIYGDVTEIDLDKEVTQKKVSIHEDASILDAGDLKDYANTYVGITFDNSYGKATSTPGMNYGLVGMGGFLLPRDWHMFSTPLSNAPLGFDYRDQNAPVTGYDNFNGKPNDPLGYYNNPWVNQGAEFNWLPSVSGTGSECADGADGRYWMKSYSEADGDGYFPTTRGQDIDPENLEDWFILDSDECPSGGKYRYPYGMDFYTWTEPDYHWINFKRNGPNHWHSDVPHVHLDYQPVVGAPTNKNEDELIVGRGYMAAITKETFMQSHGKLNDGNKSIKLTNNNFMFAGWNLVGNPYHGYIDFDKMVDNSALGSDGSNNYGILSKKDGNPFYVVYNADAYGSTGGFQDDKAGTAFRYYTPSCSTGGEYARRYLHPHQGFYVRAEYTGDLKFNEGFLVDREDAGNNGVFRDDRPAYPLVNLYLSSDQGCADVTVIEFERPEWGGAQKLKELRVGDGLFYGHHDGTYYAALFAQEGVDRVPLWFEAKEDDIFTMRWNTANADFHSMYLIDNINGIHYDMLMNDTYTFEGHKGDYPSRFLIVFNLTDVEELEDEPNVFAFHNGTEWIVTGEGLLQFIDVNGQVLWQDRLNGGQSKVSLPWVAEGPYLFRLTNSQETKVQKVIVRH